MPLRVAFVSYESGPFKMTGGLGLAAEGLPPSLRKRGIDARTITPNFESISAADGSLKIPGAYDIAQRLGLKWVPSRQAGIFNIPVLWGGEYIEPRPAFMVESTLRDHETPVYLLTDRGTDNKDRIFKREDIYGWYDLMPFTFFARGILEGLKRLDFIPDVLHLNDWMANLVFPILRDGLKDDPTFHNMAIVYTIHNIGAALQGRFPREALADTGIGYMFFDGGEARHGHQVNLAKVGLSGATLINTVSSQYRREMLTDEFSGEMLYALAPRADDIWGITNGIDTHIYDPETPRPKNVLPQLQTIPFSRDHLEGKKANKKRLQEMVGLPQIPEAIVMGSIGRMDHYQKGIGLTTQAIENIFRMLPLMRNLPPIQFVVAGKSYDDQWRGRLMDLSVRNPDRLAFVEGDFNQLASLEKLIFAGSDMYLFPSMFEPCGLSQLSAMRYGTIPIVARTGGLVDTVPEYDPENPGGRGFAFERGSSDDMLRAIFKALEVYQNPDAWQALIHHVMGLDLSWDGPANLYNQMYEEAVARHRVSIAGGE